MKKPIDSINADSKNKVSISNIPHTEPDHSISNEKDADEIVHEQAPELPDMSSEQDIDEIVHSLPSVNDHPGNEERDLDDLVHSQQIDERDEKN